MAVHPLLVAVALSWLFSGDAGTKTLPERWPWPGGEWVEELAPEQDTQTASRAQDMLQLLEPGTFKDETVYTTTSLLTRRFYLMPDRSQVLVFKPNGPPVTR